LGGLATLSPAKMGIGDGIYNDPVRIYQFYFFAGWQATATYLKHENHWGLSWIIPFPTWLKMQSQ
jgi:hypothetical protein